MLMVIKRHEKKIFFNKHGATTKFRTFTDLIYTLAPLQARKSERTNLGSEESKVGFL